MAARKTLDDYRKDRLRFVVPIVSHYRIECSYCGHWDILYAIPMTMLTKCVNCKRRIILVPPSHNVVKAGRERG